MSRRREKKRSAPGAPARAEPARFRPIGIAAALAGAVVLAVLYSQGGSLRPKPSPNVLLISIDTLRADHLGAYGASPGTPRLDALAKAGVVFERAVAQVPITLPSHASLFTAAYPFAHGVRDNGSFRLSGKRRTLTEAYRAAGYRTAAFVGSFALDSRFGLDQGFELYDDFYGDTSALSDFAISERSADAVLGPALEWLSEPRDAPWFAFIHLYDPHAPYEPPTRFRDKFASEPYRGEVAYVDEALGKFLEELTKRGRIENTLVVLTSDHGEGLGEHGERTHGMFAYESTLRVPLIFSWEGVLAPRRVSSRVRLLDVAPTLLALSGLEPLPDSQGVSLVPLLEGLERSSGSESYFEALAFNFNRGFAPLTGLYRENLKYIELPIPEIYDLESDPGETENLAPARPALVKEMSSRLAELESAGAVVESRLAVDEETRRRLQTLGYATGPGAVASKRSYGPGDDPKRLVQLSDRLDDALAAHLAGRSEEAIRLLRAIVTARPSMAKAYDDLSYVLRETGLLDEAIAALEASVANGASTIAMRARLGLYLQEAENTAVSIEILESLLAEDPGYAEAYNYLGLAYAHEGRTEKAIETFGKLLDLDESYASAYSNLGSVHLARGRYAEAEKELRKALEIDPRLAAAWNGLGVAAASTGREEEAVENWERSLTLDPRQYDTLYNLGTLLTKMNRFQKAVSYLDRFVETAPPERYREDIPKVKRLIAALKSRIQAEP
ncbi:MAG TPA: sulfatase-like hydrolase/transferase [Vicinamibacteria bacterium]|nr:sulfatase-like hydrolase/transferase [Vicinamibacteria bacterium]